MRDGYGFAWTPAVVDDMDWPDAVAWRNWLDDRIKWVNEENAKAAKQPQ